MKQITNKTLKMQQIEDKKGELIEEILRIMFVDENKTIKQIMEELDITYVTTLKWLKQAGIYSRKLNI